MKYKVNFEIEFKRNKDKGLYVAFEGIDGCGKTTQVNILADHLKSKKITFITTREPRKEGIIGDLVHKVLTGKIEFPSEALQYLFSTDRVLNHEEVILPSLREGKAVVSDRTFWSAVVYGILDKGEGYGKKSVDQLLVAHSILSMYHQFTVPDLTFYLRVPLETSMARLSAKSDTKEIYESESKIQGVLDGYEWMIQNFPDQFVVLDGTKSENEIRDEVIKRIESLKK